MKASELSSKHKLTLEAVFANPVKANVGWRAVEALFKALGADISEGNGLDFAPI